MRYDDEGICICMNVRPVISNIGNINRILSRISLKTDCGVANLSARRMRFDCFPKTDSLAQLIIA